MNAFKFLKHFIFALTIILVFSCDPNQNIDTEIIELESLSQKRNSHLIYDTMLIQYKRGLSDKEKQRIRDYYRKINFLVSWESCDENHEDFETWVILPQKDSDIPIEPEEDEDDVERSVQGATCRAL